jgi:hypothetical protein
MNAPKAHIKLQTWEWIPDNVASACEFIVYDPATILPVAEGWTSDNGLVEFDIDPGMYVIWVRGHNPMGYRPFLSDTWVPVSVLPGETLEVCAALVSVIDIPVLYQQAQNWAQWTPTKFAELLDQYSTDVQQACTETAVQQRADLMREVGDLRDMKLGVFRPVELRREEQEKFHRTLVERRDKWAEQVADAAREPEARRLAKEAIALHFEQPKKRFTKRIR